MIKLCFAILVVLYYCTTVSTGQYYVVAENTTDCLPADGECHPLSFYVANSSSYFTDHTIFFFKEGTHTLMDSVYIFDVQNISFIGENNSVTINSTFYYDSAFNFMGCTNISIVNISIIHDSEFYTYCLWIFDSSKIYIVNANTQFYKPFNFLSIYLSSTSQITIYNSQTSIFEMWDTVDMVINNILCYKFLGYYSTCLDTSKDHSLNFTNSFLIYLDISSIPYYVGLSFSNIKTRTISLSLSQNSSQSIYINNVSFSYSYKNSGLHINVDTSLCVNQLSNITKPTYHIIITNSTFKYTLCGLCFSFHSRLVYHHSILIDSCSVYHTNRGLYVQSNRDIYVLPKIIVKNTQFVETLTNLIFHVDSVVFTNVSIIRSSSTAVILLNSKLTIEGNFMLLNNKGINGGGMVLYAYSQLKINPHSNVFFIENYASKKGGGIYSESIFADCSISVPNASNVSIIFQNNTAAVAGSDIYGVDLYKEVKKNCAHGVTFKADNIKRTVTPEFLCFCDNDCSIIDSGLQPQTYLFPGQSIKINVSLWGTNYNNVNAMTDGSINLNLNDRFVDTRYVESECTTIHYVPVVDNLVINYTLNLILNQPSPIVYSAFNIPTVPFSFLPCPIGFTMSSTHDTCACSSSITAENVTCNIDTLQISHKSQLWIGPYNTSITFNVDQPNHHNICLINEQCLLCNPSNVSFMLNDTDPQCQQHKSGTLCGSCTTGYSIVLGSNECMECTTNYNLALTILFAFMGIAFVALLIILNLTVSVGTINGLLFTANIIKLYQPVFLGNQIPIPFFSQTISWLNLDFGIRICFYNGMDRYVKEWLQFVFPFYVWGIIIVIILICRVSSKVSKLVGTNAVPVLATLLLLSYTKLLRTIVAVLHKRDITLHCQNSSHQLTVWYEDPTLQYAKGKHLYLFSFALIVLVLFCLPYTLFLLLNPLFEKYLTKYRLCSFLYKIKPVLDAYSGPMKDEYRFWPGVLLVTRIPVLLAVVLVNNVIQFHYLLLSILLSVLVVIWSLTYCFQRVYNNRLHNFIETWFIFMLTAMVALAMASDGVRYTTIWYNVSIGVFTCSFIAIIGYHLCLKLDKKLHFVSAMKRKLKILKRDTSRDRSRLVRTPSYEIDRHDSITDLFEPVNTDDYILPKKDDIVSMTVVDVFNA